MRRPPVPPPTEAELLVSLATLRQESAAARPRLRQLLAAGQDTTALRTEIAALERRMEDITVMIATRGAEREIKEAAGTAGLAAALAKEAAGRIEALMASLQPPPHPHKEGEYHE